MIDWATIAGRQMHVYALSSRQRSVAWLALRGLTSQEIAAALSISEQTVKNHLTVIYEKTGAQSRVQLVLALLGIGREELAA